MPWDRRYGALFLISGKATADSSLKASFELKLYNFLVFNHLLSFDIELYLIFPESEDLDLFKFAVNEHYVIK